jgi:hypothetical protein
MWNLWLKATKYGKLPSEIFGETNSLAAWMLDSAVTWFGITIENALAERVKVTMGKVVEYKPRYSLALLLNPGFKLPKPIEMQEGNVNVWSSFLAWAGRKNSGVRRWVYVPPETDGLEEKEAA